MDALVDMDELDERNCALYLEGAKRRQSTAEENHGHLCHFLRQGDEAGYTMLLKRDDIDVNFCMPPGSGRPGPVAFEAARHFSVKGMLAIAQHPTFDPNATATLEGGYMPLLWYMLLPGWMLPLPHYHKHREVFRRLLDHPRLNIWPVRKRGLRETTYWANTKDALPLLHVGANRALLFVLAQPVHAQRLRTKHKNWLTKDLVRLVGSFLTYKKILVLYPPQI